MNSLDIVLETKGSNPTHVQISRELERQIRTEILAQGQKFPPTSVLVKQWGTNVTAVQKAMDHLNSLGLIERLPRRGTFVRKITDKAVVGLLVGPHLLDESAHFHRVIVQQLQKEIGGREMRCRVYDQLTYGNERAIQDVESQLLHDIRHHCFKGLILIGFGRVSRREEFKTGDLPKVMLDHGYNGSSVLLDWYDYMRTAVGLLASQGRTRITYLRSVHEPDGRPVRDIDGFRDGLVSAGRTFDPGQILAPRNWNPCRALSFERFGYSWMCELLEEWDRSGNRPDGLIVADDILMRGVAQALRDRGVRVPEDIAVVSSANEGVDSFYAVPVIRYVFPISRMAQELCRLLWTQLAGEFLTETPFWVKGQVQVAQR